MLIQTLSLVHCVARQPSFIIIKEVLILMLPLSIHPSIEAILKCTKTQPKSQPMCKQARSTRKTRQTPIVIYLASPDALASATSPGTMWMISLGRRLASRRPSRSCATRTTKRIRKSSSRSSFRWSCLSSS